MTCKYKEQQTLKCFFVETAKAKHWPEAAASRNYQADTGTAQLSGEWKGRATGSSWVLGLRFACLTRPDTT